MKHLSLPLARVSGSSSGTWGEMRSYLSDWKNRDIPFTVETGMRARTQKVNTVQRDFSAGKKYVRPSDVPICVSLYAPHIATVSLCKGLMLEKSEPRTK